MRQTIYTCDRCKCPINYGDKTVDSCNAWEIETTISGNKTFKRFVGVQDIIRAKVYSVLGQTWSRSDRIEAHLCKECLIRVLEKTIEAIKSK